MRACSQGRWPLSLLVGLALAGHGTASLAAPHAIEVVSQSDGMPLRGAAVAVYVKGVPTSASDGTTADMGQRNKSFVPTLLVVQAGTAVNFPNFDTVRHHVYSFSPTKPFEIKLYAGTPAQPIIFDKPGTATLGCNIHDRMVSYIHVVETPYFGVTDAKGHITLDLPAGTHRLRVWAPVLSESQAGVEQALSAGAGTVTVVRVPF